MPQVRYLWITLNSINIHCCVFVKEFNVIIIIDVIILCILLAFSSVFKPEELRQALMPTLESLYRQDPESLPFRQPVDPLVLGIPVRVLSGAQPP